MKQEELQIDEDLGLVELSLGGYGAGPLATELSLSEALRYHLASGGSRTRARIALQCASEAGLRENTKLGIATACELLHQASLLHDDVMDKDEKRRDGESVWSLYGSSSAICLGDELIASAFAELGNIDSEDMANLSKMICCLHLAVSRSAAGQSLDCQLSDSLETNLETYERATSHKSGPLLALPIELVMIVKNEKQQHFSCMKGVASAFGIAYQLIDDYEDREVDKGAQLNGYWVIRDFVSSDEEAISILNQRYQWYCRVIERGLACLPSYTQGAVKFFLNALNNKKQMVGV